MVRTEFTVATNRRSGCHATLRILATTDLHMQILPYDYFADRAEQIGGLFIWLTRSPLCAPTGRH